MKRSMGETPYAVATRAGGETENTEKQAARAKIQEPRYWIPWSLRHTTQDKLARE